MCRRLAARSCAVAARRLSDVRHTGRHPDRPPDRCDGAQLRHRCATRAIAASRTGAQLFSQPAAEGRDLRRGDDGLARPRLGAPQCPDAHWHSRDRTCCRSRRCRRPDPDATGEPVGNGGLQRCSRGIHQAGAIAAARSGQRWRAAACRAVARRGARPAVRRGCAAAADTVVPRSVADRQTRRRRARDLSPRPAARASAAADHSA